MGVPQVGKVKVGRGDRGLRRRSENWRESAPKLVVALPLVGSATHLGPCGCAVDEQV